MWVCPTRSRPDNLGRLIEAYRATGATTPVALLLDECDPALPSYLALTLPRGWDRRIGKRDGLSGIYNRFFAVAPRLEWYGLIADDVVPETEGWDRRLIETAGDDGMAVPSGGETTGGCPHFVLGGDLVRSMGWLSLPDLDRLYIDTVWGDIAKAKGVYRDCPEIMLRHRHFSNGLAPFDKTYRKDNKAQDRAVYLRWRQTFESQLRQKETT